ncbi:MAG: DUF4956 domain-containing protein, partial [Bacteroidota bacterium]|nr:DUF4956 domain-containing protein [Bacteroidota bacterium]
LVIVVVFILECKLFIKREGIKIIVYEKIELVNSTNKAQLIEDIKTRTGLNVYKVSIIKIDFLNDSAQIKIYYYE